MAVVDKNAQHSVFYRDIVFKGKYGWESKKMSENKGSNKQ